MKITINSQKLLKMLKEVAPAVVSNPIVPILESVLIEVNENTLTITASDLNTVIKSTTEIDGLNGVFSFAVPAKLLTETFKSIKSDVVSLEFKEDNSLTIKTQNGKFKIATENGADFPIAKQNVEDVLSQAISISTLKTYVSKCIFACSTDDIRPAMTGVYFSNSNFVATDGHRLMEIPTSIKIDKSAIIPKKFFVALFSAFEGKDIDVDFAIGNRRVSVISPNLSISSSLIDERFPDYKNVMPSNNNIEIEVNKASLLSSLKRISLFSNKTTNQVRFTFNDGTLLLQAEDLDYSHEGTETIECKNSESITMGFNSKLFSETLSNIDGETILISASLPNRAILIYPSSKLYTGLLMPVMLNDHTN